MLRLKRLWVAIPVVLLALPTFAADPPRSKEKVPELGEMLVAILVNGSNMGPTSGWFHASESRYGWIRLAGRFDLNNDGVLSADELEGSAALFRSLDRDGDEAVRPARRGVRTGVHSG
jgi:hypothetical protein